MRIRKCSYNDLFLALVEANKQFDGNLVFIDGTPERYVNKDRDWRVRLGVRDCHGPGAKITVRYNDPFGKCEQRIRRSCYACWHAHGTFFDALPEGTSIRTAGRTIHPGEMWEDWNVGSHMLPVDFSQSCICEGKVDPKWAKSSYEKSKSFDGGKL